MVEGTTEELLASYAGSYGTAQFVNDMLEIIEYNVSVNDNQASREELALMFVHKLMDTHPLNAAVDAAYTLADEIIEQRHI
jgi:hypothetical protein